jgi:acyl dehydratase
MKALNPFGWTITQQQIDGYAAAAGANDPIHVDPVGRAAAGGTIAQGMLVLAVMAEFVANAVPNGAAWRESGSLDVRFRAPARPGDRLTVRAVPESDANGAPQDASAAYELWCENDAGVRIVDGTARIPLAAFST